MSDLHFYRIENMLKVVEALAREKYDFKVQTNSNGTWDIVIEAEQVEHLSLGA